MDRVLTTWQSARSSASTTNWVDTSFLVHDNSASYLCFSIIPCRRRFKIIFNEGVIQPPLFLFMRPLQSRHIVILSKHLSLRDRLPLQVHLTSLLRTELARQMVSHHSSSYDCDLINSTSQPSSILFTCLSSR